MVKSGAQSLTLKSVSDKRSYRQTEKLNILAASEAAEIEPHQTWHGDGPRARSCTYKTFGGPTVVSQLGGAEN